MDMRFSAWIPIAGAVAWEKHADGFMVIPTFLIKEAFQNFLDRFTMMDVSKLVVSVIEHSYQYSVLIYDDSKVTQTNYGFILPEMNLKGYYSGFRATYKPSSKAFFTFAKKIRKPRPGASSAMKVDFAMEPVRLKKFRIIPESDLDLDEFRRRIQENVPMNLKDFKYPDEALAMMSMEREHGLW